MEPGMARIVFGLLVRQLLPLLVLCRRKRYQSPQQPGSPRRSVRCRFRRPPPPAPPPGGRDEATGNNGLDYRIAATLDTVTRQIRGRETIHYTNNSPDALRYLWMFLEQNICSRAGITEKLDQPPLVFLGSTFDFSCKGFDGGLTLEQVSIAGRAVRPTIYGTTMRIDLPRALAPGGAVDINLAWHFTVPDYGAGRMGRDGSLYQIAQWYPRLAVYDDVRGWNHDPYIGAGEFYLEYGSFDVSLTLPASYIVAATGTPAESGAGAHPGSAGAPGARGRDPRSRWP